MESGPGCIYGRDSGGLIGRFLWVLLVRIMGRGWRDEWEDGNYRIGPLG